jgi:hypothetical protein
VSKTSTIAVSFVSIISTIAPCLCVENRHKKLRLCVENQHNTVLKIDTYKYTSKTHYIMVIFKR